MARRSMDKERISRADRESRLVIETEREARDAKTARLRELRLQQEAMAPKMQQLAPTRRAPASKRPTRRVIEVD